ncbi:MAG TPA: SDR family NAD(P)-dependent oxidoreductase [Gammaproteobacteria bacterium]|nr:SDR family NAD(P)-dependent oxidoreductase [Gammaproteobacteria bacterium]
MPEPAMMEERRVAVVTGANRGLGFETSRQLGARGLKVIVTSRDGLEGKASADKLHSEGLDVAYQPLDVLRAGSIARLHDFVADSFGRLDVLVNNAAIFPEYHGEHATVLQCETELLRENLEVNSFAPLRLIQVLLPLMRRNGYGRIVNLSTGYARFSALRETYPAYRLSKVALNALTRMIAAETADENILVNCVDPGWTRTRMGGDRAPATPEDSAAAIVEAALLPDDGPSGRFLHHGEAVDW